MSDDLSDRDLAGLVRLLDASADDCCFAPSWRRWFACRSEELRGERAQRQIEAAIETDPCAYYWQGRV